MKWSFSSELLMWAQMSRIKENIDKLTRIYERYIEYVRRNPTATAQLESTVRTLSYLIAGQHMSLFLPDWTDMFLRKTETWCKDACPQLEWCAKVSLWPYGRFVLIFREQQQGCVGSERRQAIKKVIGLVFGSFLSVPMNKISLILNFHETIL